MLIIIPVGLYVLLMFYNRMEGDGTPTFTYEETKRKHEQKKQDKSR